MRRALETTTPGDLANSNISQLRRALCETLLECVRDVSTDLVRGVVTTPLKTNPTASMRNSDPLDF